MPGLVRGMARTAAVVGTATATRNAVNRRQAEKNAAAYAHAMDSAHGQPPPPPPPQQYAPPPPSAQHYYAPPLDQNREALPEQYFAPPPEPASQGDVLSQLERLGALRAQGILTEEEFAAQKAKLLGM